MSHPNLVSNPSIDSARADGTAGESAPRKRKRAVDPLILDAAQVPLKSLRTSRTASHALSLYLWLRYARPVVLVLCWIVGVFYVWHHLITDTGGVDAARLVGLYAIAAICILLLMVLLGPLQRHKRKRQRGGDVGDSTVAELADYTHLPEQRLVSWQGAQRLLVRHDDFGHLTDAAELQDDVLRPRSRVARG